MKYIISWIGFIIIVFGLMLSLPVIMSKALGTENPALTVTSNSMWPALKRGDLVIVKKAEPDEIKIGTVVVFIHQNGLAVHRIVKVSGDTYTTKGDANTAEDEPITFDEIVGS